jgi:hypothetical protein
MQSKARKPGWYTNYAKANNGRRDAPSFKEKAVVPLPALFTRTCCFHHTLSTTSSATRCHEVVAMIDSLSPEKAGGGGSTPSLATNVIHLQ